MTYREMLGLAKENGIDAVKLEIASMVDALIEQVAEERELNISEEEFEDICFWVYEASDNCMENENVDIYDLAQEELENRGYWYDSEPSQTEDINKLIDNAKQTCEELNKSVEVKSNVEFEKEI